MAWRCPGIYRFIAEARYLVRLEPSPVLTRQERPLALMGSGRPPHRSRRAELSHRALASGSDVETLVGPGMTDSGRRKPALGDSVHPIPGDRALVATLLERPPPVLDTFRSESGGHLTVGRHRVVVDVASNDSTQSPALFGHAPVSLSFDLHSDTAQFRPHSLGYRATQEPRTSSSATTARGRSPRQAGRAR